jgi:V/A-type H+-transporting ATPase subunit C
MDSTYTGEYGRLKVLRSEFLGNDLIDSLEQKEADEFIKALGNTGYRKEIDELSALYKPPDLIEVVLNAHMMRMNRSAASGVPPLARNLIAAYAGRWDIENIKVILSSKKLGYSVDKTETFLLVHRNIPVGIFSGVISREDYSNMIAQKDIEGVVNSLVKYGYGTPLLKYMDEAKKGDISSMILALDTYYYSRLLGAFRFYMGNEGLLLNYIRELIDVKNIMIVVKNYAYNGEVKEFLIKGGYIAEAKLAEMASKDINSIGGYLPFKIDDAISTYKAERFSSYIETALKRELYRKYLGLFTQSGISVEQIIGFMLRGEIERDELRGIWLGKYYNVGRDRINRMRLLKYVI